MHFVNILIIYSLTELVEHITSVLLISSFLEFSFLIYQCDVNAHTCTLSNVFNFYIDVSTVSCYSVRAIACWAYYAYDNRCLSVINENMMCWWISLCWTLKVDTSIRISSKNFENENRWSREYYNNALLTFSNSLLKSYLVLCICIHFKLSTFTSDWEHSWQFLSSLEVKDRDHSQIFLNLLEVKFLKKLEVIDLNSLSTSRKRLKLDAENFFDTNTSASRARLKHLQTWLIT